MASGHPRIAMRPSISRLISAIPPARMSNAALDLISQFAAVARAFSSPPCLSIRCAVRYEALYCFCSEVVTTVATKRLRRGEQAASRTCERHHDLA